MQTTMTKHQRLTIYIQSLLIALVSIPTLTSCVHDRSSDLCIEQEQEDPEKTDEPETYISLSLGMRPSGGSSLRAHPDGVYSINTDHRDKEDYVTELRVILYPYDENDDMGGWSKPLCENIHITGLGPGEPNALTTENNEIVFPIKKRDRYEMFIIANETAGGRVPEMTSALNAARTFWDVAMLQIPSKPLLDASTRFPLPMTFEPDFGFQAVDLDYPGTKLNPHKVILDTPTGGIELVRILAKVEVTIKDCVQATREEDGTFTLNWSGPWGFKEVHSFIVRNYLEEIFFVSDKTTYNPPNNSMKPFSLYPPKPFEACVVGLDKLADEAIGGVQLLDYKTLFYIPECVKASRNRGRMTQLDIVWRYYPDPYGDPSRIETIETPIGTLPGHDDTKNYWPYKHCHRREWPVPGSIFRNSCYRITINPYRGEVQIS